MTFKQYTQNQNLLLPPSYIDFLGESHEAVILSEFLSDLDTQELEQSYHNAAGGSAAYHPVMLLGVVIYAYMNNVFSSRQIAGKLKQDLAFMYLSGNHTPDFRTIARFRKEKGMILMSLFVQVVRKAKDLGLVSLGTCSLDGTKIYANAGKNKNTSTMERVSDWLAQADAADRLEDGLYGDEPDSLDPVLRTKAGRQQVQKTKANINRVNTTDPDSKLMQMKRKDYAQAYNVQAVTENGLMLSSSIFNSSADQRTLVPSLTQFMHAYGQTPEKLLADKGYSSEDNYAFCEQNNVDAYIPIYNPGTDLSGYTYHPKTDTYTDTRGQVYRFKQHMEIKDSLQIKRGRPGRPTTLTAQKKLHKHYKRIVYMYQNAKTKAKKYLCISPGWQKYMRQQKRKLSTLTGKLLYRKRMTDVEGVFANIKHNLNFTRFRLRGFTGVTIEWNLISLAHNLKKIL